MKTYIKQNGTFKIVEIDDYTYACNQFSKKEIDEWINKVKIKDLFKCLYIMSNDSLVDSKIKHRDRHLNILEGILQKSLTNLYPSVTYGTQPNRYCRSYLGYLSDRKYRYVDIAICLILLKQNELKQWLLNTYQFSKKEKKLLHYFND